MNLTPQQVARKIAAAASDKKARDILLLNMENLSPLTDYFIIASADNVTLVKAVADNIEEMPTILKKNWQKKVFCLPIQKDMPKAAGF